MKRSELFFGAILVPIDFFALLAAGASAYFIRLSEVVQDIRPAAFELDLPAAEYMQLVSVVSFLIIGVFVIQGLYVMQATRRAADEFTRIFSGVSIGVMIVILYTFLSAELFQSRFIVILAYILGILYVTIARNIVRAVQRHLLMRGMGVHRTMLVGMGAYTRELTSIIENQPNLGYRVVGTIPRVTWGELELIYRRKGIDEVIQTDPSLPEEDNMILLDFCEHYKIDYKYIPNMFETHAANVKYRQIGTVPVLELTRTPLDGWGRIAKRIIDVAGSLLGLVVLSPLMLATALAIRLDTAGPVLYRQMRVGRNMQPFEFLKFRSMHLEDCVGPEYGGRKAAEKYRQLIDQSNERKGPLFKMRDDPRITRVGKFIRRWRIDELPQLFVVLKGDMSLFGPRPHLAHEVERYDKFQRKLFTIKPGVSGVAQTSGSSGLPFEEEAKLDITYIENWSLKLDVILLFKTIRVLFIDRNAV